MKMQANTSTLPIHSIMLEKCLFYATIQKVVELFSNPHKLKSQGQHHQHLSVCQTLVHKKSYATLQCLLLQYTIKYILNCWREASIIHVVILFRICVWYIRVQTFVTCSFALNLRLHCALHNNCARHDFVHHHSYRSEQVAYNLIL